MANFDLANFALKATCPSNKIILDDKGLPSVMVYVPKFKISDVITGGSDSTHPAFIVNGQEVPGVYISKYQNVVYNGRAYSLPGEDPKTYITFDSACQVSEAKGPGWHLMTNAEWAALALWCRKNSTMPKGNNSAGKDHLESVYTAIPATYGSDGIINRVLTGTGPVTWSHNGEISGIWDLNGNVYEWMGGYRVVDGEIQILPNNDAADPDNSQNSSSTKWQAILQNGTLTEPGTAGTLKWDYTTDPGTEIAGKEFRLNITIENPANDDNPYGQISFSNLAAKDSISVPEIIKALSLFPVDNGDHGGDNFYIRNRGECLGYRGGAWNDSVAAGVFFMYTVRNRSYSGLSLGFRSAYIPEIS